MSRELTKKQRGFIKDYIETGNGTQAALNNYDVKDENSAGVVAAVNLGKVKIQNAIAEALPDELLAKVHREGLEATRVISANVTYGEANEKTNDFIDVPDYATRHKYLDSAYKLRGDYAPEKHLNLNANVELTERNRDLASRLLHGQRD